MAKPLDSPLPPFPPRTSSTSAPAPAPTMITRRPVATANPPSPSDTSPLSSILSAYSNRSSDSTTRSSTDGANLSAKASSPASASRQSGGASKTIPEELMVPTLSAVAPLSAISMSDYVFTEEPSEAPAKSVAGGESHPPLPPPKDSLSPVSSQSPPAPSEVSENTPVAPSLTPSPPQPQIWRRRSLKADKVPELKLATSHGSTALSTLPPSQLPTDTVAAASRTEVQPQQEKPHLGQPSPAATTKSPVPVPSPNPAFPGRNIRPVASRPALTPQTPKIMGQEATNSKDAIEESSGAPTKGTENEVVDSPGVPNRNPSRPSVGGASQRPQVARLPTPEYESGDIRSPAAERIISPVSPSSSPELPTESKPWNAPQDKGRLGGKDVRPVKSASALKVDANKLPLPSPSGLSVRSPVGLPSSPAANRGLTPDRSRFPTRTTSRPTEDNSASVVANKQEPSIDRADSPTVGTPSTENSRVNASGGESRASSEVGGAQLVEPEQVKPIPATVPENTTSQPRAAEAQGSSDSAQPRKAAKEEDPDTEGVPTPTESDHSGWWDAYPEGTIFDAPPIVDRNFRCLSGHRIMVQSRNTYYPLACQACHVKDTSIRYTCGSCWLRTCTTCRNNLYKFSGDLRALMQHNEAVLVERLDEEAVEEAAQEEAKVDDTKIENTPVENRVDETQVERPANLISTEQRAGAPWIAAA